MIICTILAAHYKESFFPYLYTILALLPIITFSHLNPKIRKAVQSKNKRNPYLIVTFSWILVGLAGSLPYLFNDLNISFIDAFFESVSGFTTTGSSILTDIEALPKSLLFWRSMTHWIGGIGIIVLVILIMPGMQIGGYKKKYPPRQNRQVLGYC
jgi:trk system potassium uptake protein TrkH